MQSGSQRVRRRRPWRKVLIVLLVLESLLIAAYCCPPLAFALKEEPRDGRALNGRVALVYSADYQIDLAGAEKRHNFDIHKYARIHSALVAGGYVQPEDFFVPEPVSREDLLRVHTEGYLSGLRRPWQVARWLEAPILVALPPVAQDACVLRAFRSATGGTILASHLALKHGIGINVGGGYHHAMPDSGGGFCIYADMPIAVRRLQAEGLIRRALVVDLDVHQGNGTAASFAGDPDIFTFDMHEGDIYPMPKAQCSLDVELPPGTGDREYLEILRGNLPAVFLQARPDIVFLQAGCDTLAGDPLARLAMTKDGIAKRDAIVIDEAVRRGIPIVVVLGGGYSPQAWEVQYASIRRTITTYGRADGKREAPAPAGD